MFVFLNTSSSAFLSLPSLYIRSPMLRPAFYLRLPLLPPLLGGGSAGYRKKRKEEEGRKEGKVVVEVGAKRCGRRREEGWLLLG